MPSIDTVRCDFPETALRLLAVFTRKPEWLSIRELAADVGGTKRGVRTHLRAFLSSGIIDQIQIGNGYRYRLASGAKAVADFQSMDYFLRQLGW